MNTSRGQCSDAFDVWWYL